MCVCVCVCVFGPQDPIPVSAAHPLQRTTVLFRGVNITDTCASITARNITCDLPAGVGVGLEVVVRLGELANSLPFLFSYDAPVITALSSVVFPSQGITVNIMGFNFGAAALVFPAFRAVFLHTAGVGGKATQTRGAETTCLQLL